MNKTKLFILFVFIVIFGSLLYFWNYLYLGIHGVLSYFGIIKLPPSLIDPQIVVSNDNYYLVFSATSFYSLPSVWLSTSRDGIHWSSPSFVHYCSSSPMILNDRAKPLLACTDYYNDSIIILSLESDSKWSRIEILSLNGSLYPFTRSLVKDKDGVFWLALEDYHSGIIYSSIDGLSWKRDTLIEVPAGEFIFGEGPRFVVNGSDLLLVMQGDTYSWIYKKTDSGWTEQMRFNSTENPYPLQYVKDSKGVYWTAYSDESDIYVKNTKDLVQWSEPIQIANEKGMEKLLDTVPKGESETQE